MRAQEARAQLKISAATPGGFGGHGFFAGFEIGAATPLPIGIFGAATPKNCGTTFWGLRRAQHQLTGLPQPLKLV